MIEDVVVAAASGLFAGVSGCTLPLYPVLLNHLTRSKEDPRWVSLFFTLGLMSVYFVLYLILGATAAFFGLGLVEAVEEWRGNFLLFGALMVWFLAYRTVRGGIDLPTFGFIKDVKAGGYFGALLSGFAFGATVTPCSAPFLVTGILPALADSRSIAEGVVLLSVFSLTFGAPLLLLGWLSGAAIASFNALKKNRRTIEFASAAFLFVSGFYFLRLFLLTV
ncbi:Cytochrome C biogenesis protein transmembrane region [uncultured archaeon]|nr:Cytochrome C biogenesis protein transmembrane region [uncultured archaeon]